MAVNVVLQKTAARRQREEAAIVEAFVRQQDYSQWVERYGIARRVDGVVDGAYSTRHSYNISRLEAATKVAGMRTCSHAIADVHCRLLKVLVQGAPALQMTGTPVFQSSTSGWIRLKKLRTVTRDAAREDDDIACATMEMNEQDEAALAPRLFLTPPTLVVCSLISIKPSSTQYL
ncbi:hypothetical protein SNOG_11302 [Parastagonospora nodorum SN15]|uniref:Uncharacterized protein n=1 Tax=Phaeosphaeria nodorum (strain SN15 / ATCC MYA-4574 / FGSC 10173) TaxID=321614 RepID=Q0UAB2_PHANO|nr:hypothetical protein SNOG_11302 [Parastagonospora nodorum SN15]EAT81010.1 hypothetical protein SNOG_11302 [Parastagonospora nodorum SN15]